jgi:peroxiredoxin
MEKPQVADLSALYGQFANQGLVIPGISAETAEKVAPFVHEHSVPYPVLLDPDRKVNALKLVASAIDLRTRQQFLAMLAKAGLR